MLTQLGKIEGVCDARTNKTGKKLLILAKGDADGVLAKVKETLEKIGYEGTPVDAKPWVESMKKGEAWLNMRETVKLSMEESGGVADAWGKEAAEAAGLTAEEAAKARDIVEDVFLKRLQAWHDEGGIDETGGESLQGGLLEAMDKVGKRCEKLLGKKKAESYRTALRGIVKKVF